MMQNIHQGFNKSPQSPIAPGTQSFSNMSFAPSFGSKVENINLGQNNYNNN